MVAGSYNTTYLLYIICVCVVQYTLKRIMSIHIVYIPIVSLSMFGKRQKQYFLTRRLLNSLLREAVYTMATTTHVTRRQCQRRAAYMDVCIVWLSF